jgi:AraC family transcriptional regulator
MQLHELVYRSGLRQPAHAHDYPSITMIVGGSLDETVDCVRWRGGAASIVVKPGGVVHDDHYGDGGARAFTLIAGCDDDVGWYRWLFAGPAATLFTHAIREWRAGGEWHDLALDLIAATWEGALRGGSTRLAEVAERVATTDVSIAALAAELSTHPVALARAFRREYGCSLSAWRRRARIRRAVELLSSTAMPLAEVALESGFTDQSHLCRVFHSDVGVTPSFFRRAMV